MAHNPLKIEHRDEYWAISDTDPGSGSCNRNRGSLKGWRNGDCMTLIVEEMRKWLEQETFRFPSLPRDFYGNINDVNSITYLLLLLSDFLKNARKSEDESVVELLSDYVQNEGSNMNLMWWMLSTQNQEEIQVIEILGPKLFYLHANYTSSRNYLENMVNSMLGMLRSWTDAYTNGQAFEGLVQLYRALCVVRRNFKAWVAGVLMAKAGRSNWQEKRSVLSIQAIKDEVSKLHHTVSSPPEPSPCPSTWSSQPAKKGKCNISCLLNTEFLFLSPEVPLIENPKPVLYALTNEGLLELTPKYLVDEDTICNSKVSSSNDSDGQVYPAINSPSLEFPHIIPTVPTTMPANLLSSTAINMDPWVDYTFPILSTQHLSERFDKENAQLFSQPSLFNQKWPCQLSPGDNDEMDSDVLSPSSPILRDVSFPNSNESLTSPSSIFYQQLLPSGCGPEPSPFGGFFWNNLIRLARLSEKEQ